MVYDYPNKIRLGRIDDGGYVIGILENDNYDFYISAGINNEESFSRDFINRYNFNKENSHGFDGTIESYPTEYTDKITFNKLNIGNINDNNQTNLHNILDKHNNIFIKMDIESYEYIWIETLNKEKLNKIKQMVIEFHGVFDDSWNNKLEDKLKCFNKLNETHYLIHAHGNNNGSINNSNIPETLELTYIRKNEINYTPEINKQKLPDTNIDGPNNPHEPDYDLCFYPFFTN